MGHGMGRLCLWADLETFVVLQQPRQVSMNDFRSACLLFEVGVCVCASECAEEMKEQPV